MAFWTIIPEINQGTGDIRDQDDHPLCWDFTLCDLISFSAVIYEHMDMYEPLSQIYICENVDKESYKKTVNKDLIINDEQIRSSYAYPIYLWLKFVKKSDDLPKSNAIESEKEFDNNVENGS